MIARWLHPGAWWLWSLSLAAAASQTTNPLLLALLIGSAVIVVASRKPQSARPDVNENRQEYRDRDYY